MHEFAKHMGAKDLPDLKILIEKQISSQYKQALDSITKKQILDQLEKSHNFDRFSDFMTSFSKNKRIFYIINIKL